MLIERGNDGDADKRRLQLSLPSPILLRIASRPRPTGLE